MGEGDSLVHSLWFALFLKAALGQKRARYPPASVHPCTDPVREGCFVPGELRCSAGTDRSAWQAAGGSEGSAE